MEPMKSAVKLNWAKCVGDQWCPLSRIDLTGISAIGVYVIWRPKENGRFAQPIRVGQGDIVACLENDRRDRRIQSHEGNPELCVTWAEVAGPPERRRGVERYLTDVLKPLVAEQRRDVVPIKANPPSWFPG